MARSRVVRAFSTGGVVFRAVPSLPTAERAEGGAEGTVEGTVEGGAIPPGVEIVLVGFPSEGNWVLPKGTPSAGESTAETAVREVREETGIEGRIVGELGSITYWFARKAVRFNKEVFHFLMVAVGGDVALHDHEYEEARWFPLAEALERLTHENEARIVRRAEPLIARWLKEHPHDTPR